MGRTWQCATCQCDFAMPERLDVEYIGEDNQRHRPVMIHRTVLGSIERFLGILIEHYGGALPAWLAPVQVAVVPVADRHIPYAEEVQKTFACAGLRVETDVRTESVSKKIRDGESGESSLYPRGRRPRGGREIGHHAQARQQGDGGSASVRRAGYARRTVCSARDDPVKVPRRRFFVGLLAAPGLRRLYSALA